MCFSCVTKYSFVSFIDAILSAMEANQCRCCLSEGLAKDLYASYVWLDRKEVYSDMLQECFNIVLTKSENGSICDSCVSQLRGALQFKHQVLQAEQDFLMKLQTPKNQGRLGSFTCLNLLALRKVTSAEKKRRKKLSNVKFRFEVKLEPKNESGSESDDYFLADTATSELIKSENTKEVKGSKRRKPVKVKSGVRAHKIRALVSRLATSIDSCNLPDLGALKKNERKPVKRKIPQKDVDGKRPSRSQLDKRKHRENLQTILKYSNAVPFKNKSLLGFICAYCDAPFPDPADLRIHTEVSHMKERLGFKNNFDMTEYNVKLDVGDLNCTLCEEKIDNLYILKQHLVKVHGKVIYSDIKDHILQFKLKKGDVFDCALCSSTYETFKMLKQHMNTHYTNYTCSKCETSFATKRSLNSHRTTHQKGSFKCQLCDKIFPSKGKQHYHEKTKHLGARRISNCPFCNEPFSSYYQRNQHLIKVHNSEAKYKCNVCNKSYVLKSLLMYHIKKTHLMERNYQCTECGYKFFSKKALTAHMVKHTGERKYSCEVCHKSYARKYTLREHMRIHNNDRRFKCDVCAMTFVQKCSLKSHLLSNHGISMAACDITST